MVCVADEGVGFAAESMSISMARMRLCRLIGTTNYHRCENIWKYHRFALEIFNSVSIKISQTQSKISHAVQL